MTANAERRDGERAAARIRALASPVVASPQLRAAVARERLAAGPPGGAGRPRLAVAGTAVVAALAVGVAMLAGPSGTPGGGSVADAAAVALRPPTAPAPRAARAGTPGLRVAGVPFPGAARAQGWRAVGWRTDRVAGRSAVTVTYARGEHRVGYTIVAGRPLPVPTGGRRLTYEGVDVTALRRGDARYITWTRGGRTCVLATRSADVRRLLELAATR